MQESQLLPQQVLSEQQSSVVIRKLLAIAVSGITYLRGLFPEKAYGKKYVEGFMTRRSSFHVRSDSSDEEALINQESVSSHRSEGDDPQRGRQLSWYKPDCSVVNKTSKLLLWIINIMFLSSGALTVRLAKRLL